MTLRLPARREDRRLVDQVGQVGAAESGGLLGENLEVDAGVERLVARVDLEDRAAAADVRPVEHHVAVEPARAEQRRVEDVGPVGGRDHDHVLVGLEPVHLDEELVEGLLALVVTATEAGATLAADRVDLVDEDDARRVLLGLVEEVADAARADADEHLDELRAADAEEGHARLTGDGLAEQRLAGPGRPDEQHALGDARADRDELVRVLEELDDLVELLLRLVDTGDVDERDRRLVTREQPGAAAAEGQRLVVAALGLAEDPQQDQRHQPEEDQVGKDDAQQEVAPAGRIDLVVVEVGNLELLRDDVCRRLYGGVLRAAGHTRRQSAHRSESRPGGRLLLIVSAPVGARRGLKFAIAWSSVPAVALVALLLGNVL